MRPKTTEALKRIEHTFGELLAKLSSASGVLAAKLLFHAQWGYDAPEWFDHRLHLLDPERYFNDFWTASADNVVRVLPLNGKLLDLCSGDGYYDRWFYSKRAAEITCIEYAQATYDFAVKHHSADNIKYVLGDVLKWQSDPAHYDVVCIRGAIEHFSFEDQKLIVAKSYSALRPGGYFCGDTPAKLAGIEKQLPSHECEWADELEMRKVLGTAFSDIETWSIESKERTTLFWRCKK